MDSSLKNTKSYLIEGKIFSEIISPSSIKSRVHQIGENISKEFGIENSNHLVNYHLKNGGISRFEKIRWFVNNILKIEDEYLIKKLIYWNYQIIFF